MKCKILRAIFSFIYMLWNRKLRGNFLSMMHEKHVKMAIKSCRVYHTWYNYKNDCTETFTGTDVKFKRIFVYCQQTFLWLTLIGRIANIYFSLLIEIIYYFFLYYLWIHNLKGSNLLVLGFLANFFKRNSCLVLNLFEIKREKIVTSK